MERFRIVLFILIITFLSGCTQTNTLEHAIKKSDIQTNNILYIYKLNENAIVFDERTFTNGEKKLGYTLFGIEPNNKWSMIDSGAQPEFFSKSGLTYDLITLSGIKNHANGFIYGVIINKNIDGIKINDRFDAQIVDSRLGPKIWFVLIEPSMLEVPGLVITGIDKQGKELYHFPSKS